MATKAQLKANKYQEESGKKLSDYELIRNLIREMPMTLNDICEVLKKPKTTVSARCSDLVNNGIIRIIGEKIQSKRSQSVFGITPDNEIEFQKMTNEAIRKNSKFRSLIKNHNLTKDDLISMYDNLSL